MNTKSDSGLRKVPCPTCRKEVAWVEENTFRPFCSKKCQLIDFCDWASERNAIPVEEGPEDFNLDDLDFSGSDDPADS